MSSVSTSAAAGKSSDNYNGNSTEKYSWSQSIKDLDVKIPVSQEIRKGKDVIVNIQSSSLEIRLLSSKSTDEPFISGEFTFRIDKEESYWNLIPGEAITIFLQKSKERWWIALLKSEEPIDPKSIESVIPMEDLAQDEQMKIQELMWKEEQKTKGQPTKDEMNLEEVLKKAWDAEGSPFKGTPYDPSLVKLGSDKLPPEFMDAVNNEIDGNKN